VSAGGPGGGGRLRALLDRLLGRDPARDADEELRFHLEMRLRDYRAQGMSEEEARRAASERLGDVEAIRREVTELDSRARRRSEVRERISEVAHDVRYGVRTLVGAPGFAATAAATLAVGIGATTAIFSLVHAVLLAPLPYAQPDRLVRVWETSPQGAERNVVSPGNVVDWRTRARSFATLAAHRQPYGVTLTGAGDPVRVTTGDVQPGVFQILGVRPRLGRGLTPEDATEGGVVVLSQGLWERRFGADPDVLERTIRLNDIPLTVVGVMPAGFDFPAEGVDLWTPITDPELDPTERTSHNYMVLARLAPGVSVERAQEEMSALAASIAAEHPAPMTGWGANVVPLHDDMTRAVGPLFTLLLVGVGLVLLIACGNIANLLLARAVSREREMAVRGALGAGRGRIVRQLLTESGVLAVVGGGLGMLGAPVLLRALLAAAPPDIPLLGRAAIDGGVLAFAAAVTLGAAVVFGTVPAWRLAGTDLEAALRGSRGASEGARHGRLRAGLLVAQVALSVVLLVGAGLFVRSFRALQATDLGFDAAGLVVMDVDLPAARYGTTPEQADAYDRLLRRAAAIPSVTGVTGTSERPGSGFGMTFSFAIEGREASNPSGREDDEELRAVVPEYFEVMGQRVLEGRAFGPGDDADAPPVVILNASLAEKHWPGGGAVGERIAFRVGETPWREIVGVVEDARMASPDREAEPALYIPHAQKRWDWLGWLTVVARTEKGADPEPVQEALRAALLEVDPALPPQAMGTVEGAFRESTARRSFAMTLVLGFGGVALLLSVIGLYGLIRYSVARRRREFGVRIALGAESGDVVGPVLRRSLGLALAGTALGVVGALASSPFLEGLLYGVSPVDLATYAATAGLVLVVAVAAAAPPAWRAARTDPVKVLKVE